MAYDPNGPRPPLGGEFTRDGQEWFNAAFADGKLRFLRAGIDERTLRAFITRNGGEKVDLSRLE
jgi:hypothetical protein